MVLFGEIIVFGLSEIFHFFLIILLYVCVFNFAHNKEFNSRFAEHFRRIRPSDLAEDRFAEVIGDILSYRRVVHRRRIYAITSVSMVFLLTCAALWGVPHMLVNEALPRIIAKSFTYIHQSPGLLPILFYSVLFTLALHAYLAFQVFLTKPKDMVQYHRTDNGDRSIWLQALSNALHLQRLILDSFILSILRHSREGDHIPLIASRTVASILRSTSVDVSEIEKDYLRAFYENTDDTMLDKDTIHPISVTTTSAVELTPATMLFRLIERYGLPFVFNKYSAHRSCLRSRSSNRQLGIIINNIANTGEILTRRYNSVSTGDIVVSPIQHRDLGSAQETDFRIKISCTRKDDWDWISGATSGLFLIGNERSYQSSIPFLIDRSEKAQQEGGTEVVLVSGRIESSYQQNINEFLERHSSPRHMATSASGGTRTLSDENSHGEATALLEPTDEDFFDSIDLASNLPPLDIMPAYIIVVDRGNADQEAIDRYFEALANFEQAMGGQRFEHIPITPQLGSR